MISSNDAPAPRAGTRRPFERSAAYPTSMGITVALGTFHTTMLVLVFVAFLYFNDTLGDALNGLNTLLGLALFAALWAIICATTNQTLDRLGWPATFARHDIVPHGMFWGGVTGVAVIVVSLPVLFVAAIVDTARGGETDPIAVLLVGPVVGAFASPFAFATGAFLGLWVALVDSFLVWIVDQLMGSGWKAASSPAPRGVSGDERVEE